MKTQRRQALQAKAKLKRAMIATRFLQIQKSADKLANVNTADAAGVEDDESREVADLGRPKKVSAKTATDAEPRKTQGPDREISELWDPKGADPPLS